MTILQKYDLAGRELANRFVMAPMTRARRPDYIANEETATYYRQRASAGLIITEGTPVSPEAQGYINVPGIWTAEQTAGWKLVTDGVHEAGGTIFAQLWHVGRMSHTSLQPDRGAPVSSTNKPVRNPKSMVFTYNEDGTTGFVEPSIPRALDTEEVARVTADFAHAARNAATAGFDGVELHAANGYLFEQFLNPILNDRTDHYGGSVENRARFTLETVDALIKVLGADRVGIRLAPHNQQFDMQDYDGVEETYFYLADQLAKRGVAYIHLNDNWAAGRSVVDDELLTKFRQRFSGTIILAGAMRFERAERLVEAGVIDLPAFGQPFIANPDLVERYRGGLPLAEPERATYYGGGNEGYIDYPHAAAG
ncbi:2,4-dienoyl-CoA reductase-like NADH-dependent reductase (Old Yellow Enzyme family) [Comamonas sp. BIGb0124]|uniref:alkene reductase n=1 Tax=Comamonas sp. BIGb0124 TaxID=2485130 RepID=UPI000F49E81C|nr:alkene reductase [Comamonas sp. BIGb0124]ROR24738.1 2,4-dienoyl-CoA reductase-like NADH-dependent reductase (Old Yellow Enzyme family) [Comamonas sp. BIGb0124]